MLAADERFGSRLIMLDKLILMRSTLKAATKLTAFQDAFITKDQQVFRLVQSIIWSEPFWQITKRLVRVLRPVCRLLRWYDSLATSKAPPWAWLVNTPAHTRCAHVLRGSQFAIVYPQPRSQNNLFNASCCLRTCSGSM